MPDDRSPEHPCPVCSGLRDEEHASQKWGWEHYDTSLPAAVGSLMVVRDLSTDAARALQLLRCPVCGTHYLYRTDYEYLVNGSEDTQSLTRLSDDEAAGLGGDG